MCELWFARHHREYTKRDLLWIARSAGTPCIFRGRVKTHTRRHQVSFGVEYPFEAGQTAWVASNGVQTRVVVDSNQPPIVTKNGAWIWTDEERIFILPGSTNRQDIGRPIPSADLPTETPLLWVRLQKKELRILTREAWTREDLAPPTPTDEWIIQRIVDDVIVARSDRNLLLYFPI